MPIFMLKCETCNSERQDPKLRTITCPDCGSERDFVKVLPPENNERVVNADVVSPDLEALRKKYLGNNHERKPVKIDDKSVVVVNVLKPGNKFPTVAIIDSESETIIGEQG